MSESLSPESHTLGMERNFFIFDCGLTKFSLENLLIAIRQLIPKQNTDGKK
jgi:hypothetical protein